MLRCMYSGISGMKVNQSKLDVIGNNIANVSTTAFKSSRAEFSDMLYQNSSSATSATANKGGTNAKQVGLGAQLSSIDRLMSQGNLLSTGRSLDVSVDGEGYFIVGTGSATGATTVDGNEITGGDFTINYTRDGSLQLDHDGNLVTADGYRVLGYALTSDSKSSLTTDDGVTTVNYIDADATDLKADEANLVQLKIPDEVTTGDTTSKIASFSIGSDGVITAVLADGTRAALGQIATATFKNPAGLTSVGGNLYEVSSNSGTATIISGKGSDSDNSKAFGDIVQGCLEASNVDLTEQFTEMITATRSFQASSKMITTGDEILQTITGLMR